MLYLAMLYLFWLGTSLRKSDISDKKCKVWKSFPGYEDRVNRFIFACSPFAHFRCCFFSWKPSTLWMERENHVFSFFSFHNKDLNILETDAAWDMCSSSLPPELHLGHGFWFSRADFSSQGWGLSPVAHNHQCCSHTIWSRFCSTNAQSLRLLYAHLLSKLVSPTQLPSTWQAAKD